MTPTEAQFRQAVIELCEWTGHRVYSIKRSDLAIVESKTGIGFPDLVIAGNGRLLIPELKRARDTRTLDQHAWAAALPADVYRLWTASDMDAIQTLLTRKRA